MASADQVTFAGERPPVEAPPEDADRSPPVVEVVARPSGLKLPVPPRPGSKRVSLESLEAQAEASLRGVSLLSEKRLPPDAVPDVLEELTVMMVVIYAVHQALRTRDLQSMLRAVLWMTAGFVLAFTSCMCLLALGISSNWPRCIARGEADDCPLGLACVEIQQTTGGYTRPLCNDCYFLADRYGRADLLDNGTIQPWVHRMAKGPLMDEPNASRFCIEKMLLAPEFARVQPLPDDSSTFTFEHCLYARLAAEGMSSLDLIVLQLCFALVALQVARDAKEQYTGAQLRQLCLPWFLPERTLESWQRLAATTFVIVLESVIEKGVPALVPYAMLSLVVSDGGTNAETIILNGLSVGFVLELDNVVTHVFLDLPMHARTKAFFAELATTSKPRKKSAAVGTSLSKAMGISQRSIEVERGTVVQSAIKGLGIYSFITWMICYAGLNHGFARATGPESRIHCELITHYFFYRIGLQFGLWWLLASRTCFALAIRIPSELLNFLAFRRECLARARAQPGHGLRHDPKEEVRAGSLKLLRRLSYHTVRHVISPFIETMIAAVALSCVYWFASLIYYRIDISYAARKYLWSFVKDVFGECASSGFGDAWGIPCIPGS